MFHAVWKESVVRGLFADDERSIISRRHDGPRKKLQPLKYLSVLFFR